MNSFFESFSNLKIENKDLEKCNCELKDEITDYVSGDVICTRCGIVKDEYIILNHIDFDENDNLITSESSRDIFFENITLSTSIQNTKNNNISGLMYKIHSQGCINQKQVNRYKDLSAVEKICDNLQLNVTITNTAKSYFHQLCNVKIFRGINRKAMMICCIMRSCVDNKIIRSISELTNASDIQKNILIKNIKTYEKLFDTKIIFERNAEEIYRFVQQFENIKTKRDMCMMSNQVILEYKSMLKDIKFQGKSPKVLLAIILKPIFDKHDISKILDVSITAF